MGLQFEEVERTEDWVRFRFRFQSYSELRGDFETVTGDFYRSLKSGRPGPLLLLSPILAGPVDDYAASRYFARRAASRGISSFFLHQETVLLEGTRDAWALEAMLRENLRRNLQALALFVAGGEADSTRLGSLGVSLGAIKNVPLIAAEPRLRANVLMLAGAHLDRILLESNEDLVVNYLNERRRRDGRSPQEVAEEFRERFRYDPARVARSIEPERVLLFLGSFDDKVPFRRGLELRRLLGGPETYVFPLGHYTAVVAAPWAATRALDWLEKRWKAGREKGNNGAARRPGGVLGKGL